ncbi:MAG: DUF4361 domain-containing protein [Tannerella sp.]|nr:DUF4361 domain-containing protein [Tannerella sp.]
MKIRYIILMVLAGVMTIFSCDNDELFEREQYKKTFALLSDDDGFNIFSEEHDLELTDSPGFISAICGGSLPTEKDINIAIIEDDDLLADYNSRNFGDETGKHARRLPQSNYDIAKYNITIPAGERKGLMSIEVNANGLSPDSVYMLPLSVARFSSYEMNLDKRTVLYRVYMKNYYATNTSEVNYNYRSKIDGINYIGLKRVFPVHGNSVRIMAGNISFESNENIINSGAIVLTVDENNNVQITSWKNMTVTQIDGDPDFPNTFSIVDDGYNKYKTFLLHYKYSVNEEEHDIQEELRIEFEEEIKY